MANNGFRPPPVASRSLAASSRPLSSSNHPTTSISSSSNVGSSSSSSGSGSSNGITTSSASLRVTGDAKGGIPSPPLRPIGGKVHNYDYGYGDAPPSTGLTASAPVYGSVSSNGPGLLRAQSTPTAADTQTQTRSQQQQNVGSTSASTATATSTLTPISIATTATSPPTAGPMTLMRNQALQ
jgi:hypothetical protein